jgi:hypothetical protein
MKGINDIVFVVVVLGALIMTWYQARAYRQVATKVLKSNAEVAKQAAEADAETSRQLASIHILVNSNLSTAQQNELNATRRDLASLEALVSLKESQGLPVSEESLGVIEEVKARIKELSKSVKQKDEKTVEANKQ